MRRAWKMSSFPDAGTAVFLVSGKWSDKYKEYLFFREAQSNREPTWTEDHAQKNHPGQINNSTLLHTDDKYLQGTGELKEFESDVVDRYLKADVREMTDYEIFSEEMYQFVK